MSDVFGDVKTFMNAVGQTVGDDNKDLANLYHKLIIEEYTEFLNAHQVSNDTEILDACFDMIWVIAGYMHSRGWDCESSWVEGARSNLSKIDPNTGKVRRREDGKILKPEGWQSPNFKQFV